MQIRLSNAAGFLAAATLLSGSAFAFAPEFDNDLPTVIISDRTASGSAYDSATTGTAYLFRYSGAFDLRDYINENGNSSLRVQFNEYLNSTNGVPQLANLQDRAAGTLNIAFQGNAGQRAYADGSNQFPAVAGDFASAADLDTTNPILVDFRNRDFSGDAVTNGPFDNIGDVTGYDIDLSGPQRRIVELYVKGNLSADYDINHFLVITQKDGNDGLTAAEATDPWQAFVPSTNDFSAWTRAAIGQLASYPVGAGNGTRGTRGTVGLVSGFTFTPASGAPTTSIAAQAAASQIGLATWGSPATAYNLAANKLYRLRAKVASGAVANGNSRSGFRIRFGNLGTTGSTILEYLSAGTFNAAQPALPGATAEDLYAYVSTKGAGAVGLNFDLTAFSATAAGEDFTVSELQIDQLDRTALTGKTVILNRGGAVSPAAGQIAVEAGEVAFNNAAVEVAGTTVSFANLVNAQAVAITPASRAGGTTGQVKFTFQPNASFGNLDNFARFGFSPNTSGTYNAPEAFVSEKGKLYTVDLWLSTDTPASALFPSVRLQAYNNNTNFPQAQFDLQSANGDLKIGSLAKAYTLVFTPQGGTENILQTELQFDLDSLAKDYAFDASVIVHRVVVTQYDNP